MQATIQEKLPLRQNLDYSSEGNCFLYFSSKAYVMGTQKNRLIETVLLPPKTQVYFMGKKIITILRS